MSIISKPFVISNSSYNYAKGINEYVKTNKGAIRVLIAAKLSFQWLKEIFKTAKYDQAIHAFKSAEKLTSIPKALGNIINFFSEVNKGEGKKAGLSLYNIFKESFVIYKLGAEFSFYKLSKYTKYIGGIFSFGLIVFSIRDLITHSLQISDATANFNAAYHPVRQKIESQKINIAVAKLIESICWTIDGTLSLVVLFFASSVTLPTVLFLSLYTTILLSSVTSSFLADIARVEMGFIEWKS